MSSGSQPAGNTTTTTAPPSYMLPYISTALGRSNNLLGYQPQFYPGNTVAGFSQPQQQAMQGIVNAGMNGSPALSAAQDFDTTLLKSGGGANPYLDTTFQQAAGATQNQLASEFGGAGRNVEASEPLRARQLDDLATGIYGSAYQQDIQNALAAGNQAQSLYGAKLGGLQAAEGVGRQVQNLAQQEIGANQDMYNYYQQLPLQTLQGYEGMLGGVQPGSAQSTPYFTNPTANTLGTIMSLAQLIKMM